MDEIAKHGKSVSRTAFSRTTCLQFWNANNLFDSLFRTDDLYLHDNSLTGTLPVTIKDMNRLQHFRVYWNDFVGTVPMEICDLMDLKLSEFKADCDGENPSITCKCCTECFS